MIINRISSVIQPYIYETNNVDTLLDAIDKLTGMELLQMQNKIHDQFQKVIDREENFFLHDYVDDWFYLVNYEDESYYLYTKGKEAYEEYMRNDRAIAITRKSKDLFPVYQTMMSKIDGYVYIPLKKGKEKEVSKKDYDIQYQKEMLKRVYFVLNKKLDGDIIEFLAEQENVNKFLKDLVRKEMKKQKKE